MFRPTWRPCASGMRPRPAASSAPWVQIDLHAVSLSSLPESMTLSRGRLEISFRSVDQLAEDMFTLVRILDAETDRFIQAYEPEPPPGEDLDETAREVEAMFRELEAMEAAQGKAGGA